MANPAEPFDTFEIDPDALPGEGEPRLILDLDGFEGPLDLMLDLARREKLDLRSISILTIADQYLAFIREAQRLRLELAGDYLVMAAWLTYLKSRLLLPKKSVSGEPEADELVEDLALRLQRLETLRKAGEWLSARLAATRETAPRGAIEPIVVEQRSAWELRLLELVSVYAERRIASVKARYTVATRKTLSIPEARNILMRLVGEAGDWCPIDILVAAIRPAEAEPRSARASSFVAALELAREGALELRQEAAFAPLYLRTGRKVPDVR
ncbi:MAG: ScpA family protein [Beijerinckiaceae bacterium]|nr:ScpA family protein [Beijerinckiaceae bacterium]